MITEKQTYFMQLAINLARLAIINKEGEPFGAIIVKHGDIIGSSGNCTGEINSSIHAEVLAIRNACKNLKSLDLSDCEIYTSSEPCPMCLAAIYWSQISSIYFYTGLIKAFDQKTLNPRLIKYLKLSETNFTKNNTKTYRFVAICVKNSPSC